MTPGPGGHRGIHQLNELWVGRTPSLEWELHTPLSQKLSQELRIIFLLHPGECWNTGSHGQLQLRAEQSAVPWDSPSAFAPTPTGPVIAASSPL